jgi:hypothetical protein
MSFTDVWIKTAVDQTRCNGRSSDRRDAADGRTFQGSAVLSVAVAVRIAIATTNAGNAAIRQDERGPTTLGH